MKTKKHKWTNAVPIKGVSNVDIQYCVDCGCKKRTFHYGYPPVVAYAKPTLGSLTEDKFQPERPECSKKSNEVYSAIVANLNATFSPVKFEQTKSNESINQQIIYDMFLETPHVTTGMNDGPWTLTELGCFYFKGSTICIHYAMGGGDRQIDLADPDSLPTLYALIADIIRNRAVKLDAVLRGLVNSLKNRDGVQYSLLGV